MYRDRWLLALVFLLVLVACQPASPEARPTPTAAPTYDPAVDPTPTLDNALNPAGAMGLAQTESIAVDVSIMDGVDWVMPSKMQVDAAGQLDTLLTALDTDLVLTTRVLCSPFYTITFRLPGGVTRELGVITCNPEAPHMLRGDDRWFEGRDAVVSAPLRLVLDALVDPILPRPGPTATPSSIQPQSQPEPGEEVPDEVRRALAQALPWLASQSVAPASPDPVAWEIVPATPKGLVGAAHYEIVGGEWRGRLIVPVVAPDQVVYGITLTYQPNGYVWTARVDAAGQVTVQPPEGGAARPAGAYPYPAPGRGSRPVPTPMPPPPGTYPLPGASSGPQGSEGPGKGAFISDEVRTVLDGALAEWRRAAPDRAPAAGLAWSVTQHTPKDTFGMPYHLLEASGWSGRIDGPSVGADGVGYQVLFERTGSDRVWGAVVGPDGVVRAVGVPGAGARESHEYADPDWGHALTYGDGWIVERGPVGGKEDVVSLVRDGWRLIVDWADDREDLCVVMGGAAGEWQESAPLPFLQETKKVSGSGALSETAFVATIGKRALVYEGQVKALIYYGEVDGRHYDLHLLDAIRASYDQVVVPVGLEREVDAIVMSLRALSAD